LASLWSAFDPPETLMISGFPFLSMKKDKIIFVPLSASVYPFEKSKFSEMWPANCWLKHFFFSVSFPSHPGQTGAISFIVTEFPSAVTPFWEKPAAEINRNKIKSEVFMDCSVLIIPQLFLLLGGAARNFPRKN